MSENLPAKTEPAPLTREQKVGPVGDWHTLGRVLETKSPEMARVVNAALAPDKLIQLALTAMRGSKSPEKIVKCTGLSVAKTIMDLAMTGLSPAPQLGLVCFVPYGKELQLQIEYRGFIALAKRSGQVSYITADTVREGDDFSYERGTEQFLRHVPRGVGEATHYYALVRFKDGSSDFRVMTREQVEAHRDKFSKQYIATKRGPWKDHPDPMGMKTCIRQLCKLLDLSPEMTHAARLDEYNEAGVGARSLDMNKPGRSGFDLSPRQVESESVPSGDTETRQSEQEPPPRDPDSLGDDDDIAAAFPPGE